MNNRIVNVRLTEQDVGLLIDIVQRSALFTDNTEKLLSIITALRKSLNRGWNK